MKSLISLIAIIWLATSDPTMISKDGYLDPGRITWWQDKWAPNPIDLSQTNAGSSNVLITVNFRPFTSINSSGNLGIVQVTVPSTFSTTTTYTSTSMQILGGTDYSFSFKVSSLPSQAVYGPFQIVTRSTSTGQIYDANYVFGCVAIGRSAPSANSNSLKTAAATLTPTTGFVGEKDSIIFTFSIPAGINLWKHDIFEIIPDQYWSISADTPSCFSVDVSTNYTNYIKGPKEDNSLPCAIAMSGGASGGLNTDKAGDGQTNSVYIYGLSQDVIVESAYEVQLKVGSFVFPGSARPSNSYAWKIKIWRWGTTTLIAQFMGSGPLTPVPGSITATWAPYNSKIVAGDIPSSNAFSIFTKLDITVNHAITTGTITATFSGADISSAKWYQDHADSSSGTAGLCYLNNYAKGVTCKVSDSTATITFDSKSAGLAAKSTISITLLTKLSASAKVSSIISSDSAANIDKLGSAVSWTFISSTNYHSMTNFEFFATDSVNYKGATGFTASLQLGGKLISSQNLMWFMQPSTSWAANTNLVVNLPISLSGIQLSQTYINVGAQYYDAVISDKTIDTPLTAPSSTTGNSHAISEGNPGSITITFTAGNFPSSSQYFAFAYGDPSTGDKTTTALPFVQSNIATFYEIWAKVTPSGSSTATEFYNYVYSVFTLQTDPDLTVNPLCTDKYAGIPIAVNFHALNFVFSFTDKNNFYYLDVTFSDGGNNLGTGLSDGDNMPVVSTKSGVSPVATITSNVVTISGLGSVASGSSVGVLLPNGADGGSLSATASFYYLMAGGDPTIKMALYYKTSSNSYNTGSINGFNTQTISTPTNGLYTVGAASSTSSGNFIVTSNAVISQDDWIGVGLSSGFTISTSGASLAFGGASSTSYSVSSSSSSFVGGFIVGKISSRITPLTSTATTFSIGGLISPLSTGKTSNAVSSNLVVFSASATPNSACTVIGNVAISVNAAKITVDTCVLDKPYTQGSDSADASLLLSFTTVNPIPGDGVIVITFATGTWTIPSTYPLVATCQGQSFKDFSSTAKSACSVSETKITLTGFAEIAAGAVYVNIYHIIPSTTATSLNCFTEVNTYDADGFLIDSATGLTNSFTVTASSDVGKTDSTSFTAKAYPNFPGAISDIFLSFSFSKPIPQYSIIKITPGFVSSWTFSGDITNSCWSNKDTYSCTVSDSSVSLQLGSSLAANEKIMVYLDSALTLPTSSSASAGWTISTSWNGIPITADQSPFLFTIGSVVTSTITSLSIAQGDSINAGEPATYKFSFSTSANITVSDYFVIEFPKEFDPHIGDAKLSLNDCFENNWYLSCSSTVLGITSGSFCSVDHWKLVVSGISKAITDSSLVIDISVNMVQNPSAGTFSKKFNVYQYASDGSVKAYVQKDGSLTIGSNVANIISLKDFTASVAELSNSATYIFNFYLESTYSSDNTISIIFPQQFNIKLRNKSTIVCQSNYFDESSISASYTSRTFSTSTSCSINENNINLPFLSDSTLNLASTSRIQIQLTSLYNPEWGFLRTSGWDITDYSTFSTTSPDVWSNKFDIAIYESSSLKTYAKSYGILNSAYLGYTLSAIDISVGTYEPNTASGGIKLLPGQQSKYITISVLNSKEWPMKSKSFKLSPITNVNYPDDGNIKYTSIFHNFTAYQMTSEIKFRVSAAISTATGIYYIDWGKPVESKQEGVSNDLYSAPVSMLVEVCSSLEALTISIDTLPTFYSGYTSLPIRVSPSYPPATQLIITPSFSVTGLAITPTSLQFGPDVDELYFQVYVDSKFSSKEGSLSFKLSGTDVSAYVVPKSMTATVSSTLPSTLTVTPAITGTSISGSEYKISITTTLSGVLYWGLGCQGKKFLSFEDLTSMVSDLVTPSSVYNTLQEQLIEEYQHTETDKNTTKGDTDIYSFFKRIHAEHCDNYWASSEVISSSQQTTLDLNWLMAGTNYTLIAYIATKLTNDTGSYPLQTYNFTTINIGQLYTTSVTFNGSLPANSTDTIRNVLAKNMGINPSWLTTASSSTRRELSDILTTFTYNVLSDSRYPAITSQMITENLDSSQASSDLFSLYSVEILSIGLSNAISAGQTPQWITSPVMKSIAEKSVTFVAATSVAGKIYTSCTNNDITGHKMYPWQIVDGLDATSSLVPSGSAVSDASAKTNITVTELEANTFYICYFTACNDYPLTPTCIDASLPSYSIRTKCAEGETCSTSVMGISASLALVLGFLIA